jgi:hypothetical protein
MPSYMDVHDIPGVTAEDVAKAHEADVRVQGQYGVNYKQYWVDEADGKVFCLVDAPDKDTATRVHREAHGLEAHTLYEVEAGSSRSRSQPAARGRRSASIVPAHVAGRLLRG